MRCPKCGRLMVEEHPAPQDLEIDVGETWDFIILCITCYSCRVKFRTKIEPEDLSSLPD